MSLDDCWNKVREFQDIFGHPVGTSPGQLESERVAVRSKWMAEEIEEFQDAETMYDQADAMIDLIYFAIGTLVELGIRPGKLFDVVHGANMRKLWPDRKPRFAVDGKTIKPDDWRGPEEDIRRAVDEQVEISDA